MWLFTSCYSGVQLWPKICVQLVQKLWPQVLTEKLSKEQYVLTQCDTSQPTDEEVDAVVSGGFGWDLLAVELFFHFFLGHRMEGDHVCWCIAHQPLLSLRCWLSEETFQRPYSEAWLNCSNGWGRIHHGTQWLDAKIHLLPLLRKSHHSGHPLIAVFCDVIVQLMISVHLLSKVLFDSTKLSQI